MTDELERGWLSFANSVWLSMLLTFTGEGCVVDVVGSRMAVFSRDFLLMKKPSKASPKFLGRCYLSAICCACGAPSIAPSA
jgi:hypothetical protein